MKEGVGAIAEKMGFLRDAVAVPSNSMSLWMYHETKLTVKMQPASVVISSARLTSRFYAKPPVLPIPLADRIIAAAKHLIGLDLSGAPIEHQVLRENLRYALGPYVIVDGEWCTWREDEVLGVVVKREPWSLLGVGRNLGEAIEEFRDEAEDFAVSMQQDRAEDLSAEARRMQDSVMRYLPEDG